MVTRLRYVVLVTAIAILLAGVGLVSPLRASTPAVLPTAANLPGIGHVFIIMLENKSYTEVFGSQASADSADSYLQKALPAEGALLQNYYGTSHYSHSNYVTLVSGQPPNAYNQTDCPYFRDFNPTQIDSEGIAHGIGCVFPKTVKTVGDQLSASGKSWKAYAESMDSYNGPGLTPGPGCRHPATNGYDPSYSDDWNFVTRHVPFLYFKAITDSAKCKSLIVDDSKLKGDLANEKTTPNLSFIVPNTCSDGHDATCVDGSTGGLPAINKYLQTAVPQITQSPAFKKDGLLLILFDEAEFDGPDESASACCNTPLGPNSVSLGGPVPGPGGGRTGAVAISPFIKPGTISTSDYNHYSSLRTIEDVFSLAHLGYAARSEVSSFGEDVFTQPRP
ncbi:MAG TPA: phosphoesterase [Actinobacteria bacterium]|nr:phosphoesterase [Actinomycetota bacterium]